MRAIIKIIVESPVVDCTERELKDWIGYELGLSSKIKTMNPLIDFSLKGEVDEGSSMVEIKIVKPCKCKYGDSLLKSHIWKAANFVIDLVNNNTDEEQEKALQHVADYMASHRYNSVRSVGESYHRLINTDLFDLHRNPGDEKI